MPLDLFLALVTGGLVMIGDILVTLALVGATAFVAHYLLRKF